MKNNSSKNDRLADLKTASSGADSPQTTANSRRRFLQLGLAVGATTLAGCPQTHDGKGQATQQGKSKRPEQGIDLEKWKRIKGKAYETGSGPAPGVCQLPGPQKKEKLARHQ